MGYVADGVANFSPSLGPWLSSLLWNQSTSLAQYASRQHPPSGVQYFMQWRGDDGSQTSDDFVAHCSGVQATLAPYFVTA